MHSRKMGVAILIYASRHGALPAAMCIAAKRTQKRLAGAGEEAHHAVTSSQVEWGVARASLGPESNGPCEMNLAEARISPNPCQTISRDCFLAT